MANPLKLAILGLPESQPWGWARALHVFTSSISQHPVPTQANARLQTWTGGSSARARAPWRRTLGPLTEPLRRC